MTDATKRAGLGKVIYSVDDKTEEQTEREEKAEQAEVREADEESFPASDPPAWGGSVAAPTQASAAATHCEVQAIEPLTWVRRHVREVVVISLAALGALIHGVRRYRSHAA